MQKLLVLILAFVVISCQDPGPGSSTDILDRSIAYHDPDGLWKDFKYELNFVASRPDSTERKTTVQIDLPKRYFRYLRPSADADLGIQGDSCFNAISDTVDCTAIKRIRNYYTYLWGLPMKLKDPETDLDPEFMESSFEGQPVYRLKVTYPNEIYYFSFDKETYQLVGEEFYKDEAKNLGEKMIRGGEVNLNGLKLPQTRAWYNTHDSLYLATDKLDSFSTFSATQ